MHKNGGPAFPRPVSESVHWDHPVEISAQEGMTLRDYFAAKALCSFAGVDFKTPELQAEAAYKLADAMLAAREMGDA